MLADDPADRRTFVLDDAAWTEMQARLNRPPRRLPEVARLLADRCTYVVALAGHALRRCGSTDDVQVVDGEPRCAEHR